MCREKDWRHCHRQFLADFFVKRGFEVIHMRRRGEERHIPTACFDAYDPPPVDLVKRVYADFSRLCGGASIYLFGGALDGIAHDVDVVAYGAGGTCRRATTPRRSRSPPRTFSTTSSPTGESSSAGGP